MAGLAGFHRRRIEKTALEQEVLSGSMHLIEPRNVGRELSLASFNQEGVQCSHLGGAKTAQICPHEDICDGSTCMLFEAAEATESMDQ